MLYKFDGKQPVVGENSYVSDTARVIGDVVIEDNCYIGHGAILRGDYGRIEIGDGTAVEEGVIVHAPPNDVNRIGKNGRAFNQLLHTNTAPSDLSLTCNNCDLVK